MIFVPWQSQKLRFVIELIEIVLEILSGTSYLASYYLRLRWRWDIFINIRTGGWIWRGNWRLSMTLRICRGRRYLFALHVICIHTSCRLKVLFVKKCCRWGRYFLSWEWRGMYLRRWVVLILCFLKVNAIVLGVWSSVQMAGQWFGLLRVVFFHDF